MPEHVTLLTNACILDENGRCHDGYSVAICNNQIQWVGQDSKVPDRLFKTSHKEDCQGYLITPALIDCHTHLVYASNRADEFQKKLQGASYETIAKSGGGIISTVRQTRQASSLELFEQSLPRLKALQREGVMTVEIKSGYGLDLETELKILRVAKALGKETDTHVFTTFLGAHAIPPEYINRRQDYVAFICHEVIPKISEEGLADAVDVFCDSIGFTLDETQLIFDAAQKHELPIKCHAEQLSNQGASILAARYNALSTDHLEHLDEKGIDAMKKSGTVAVLLPGAYYFLNETKRPPIELLRSKNIGMALATDSNPGSSPTTSLQLMLSMACHFFALTVEEALSAVTYQASRALGMQSAMGSIAKGQQANLLKWPIKNNAMLCYTFGTPYNPELLKDGKWVHLRES